LLVTVTPWPVAEVVPTACTAKAGSVLGETEAPGAPAMPVPVKPTVLDSGAVSEMVKVAFLAPRLEGVNTTSTVQVEPAVRVALQWLVKPKLAAFAPVIVGVFSVIVEAPLFLTVTV